MKSAQMNVKEYSYFVNNQWRKAADNKFFEVHEPYSGGLFARVAAGSRADARAAVDAAAYFKFHAPQGFWPLLNDGEGAVHYCFIFLSLASTGGGPWSFDRLLRKRASTV
jgi:hypothetical protein